jgi:methylmalonyl-CoA mutase cobalamin-binding subunit
VAAGPIKVLALPANDATDILVLKMLELLLEPAGQALKIAEEVETPLKVVERVAAESPDVVLISHVPPDGLTAARYLVRRIRSRHPRVTILVGRWGQAGEAEAASERLGSAGASKVFGSLAEGRDYLIGLAMPKPKPADELAPAMEQAGV